MSLFSSKTEKSSIRTFEILNVFTVEDVVHNPIFRSLGLPCIIHTIFIPRSGQYPGKPVFEIEQNESFDRNINDYVIDTPWPGQEFSTMTPIRKFLGSALFSIYWDGRSIFKGRFVGLMTFPIGTDGIDD